MTHKDETLLQKVGQTAPSRRGFLKIAGGLTGIALVSGSLASCHDDTPTPADTRINLGSGDVGVLNYAYALEQLEAAFYTQVIASQYSGMDATERALLTDIRDHEIAHREFFKLAIAAAGGTVIPTLTADQLNFSTIDFGSRDSVLGTAKAFEDLGVAAYNGAGKLITTPDYLVIAGQIVSVEARHAGLIRDLISNGSFAASDVVDAMGLDKAKAPAEVLGTAHNYVKVVFNADNLPTS